MSPANDNELVDAADQEAIADEPEQEPQLETSSSSHPAETASQRCACGRRVASFFSDVTLARRR
jgi:hypothetical protein